MEYGMRNRRKRRNTNGFGICHKENYFVDHETSIGFYRGWYFVVTTYFCLYLMKEKAN